jgi:transposase
VINTVERYETSTKEELIFELIQVKEELDQLKRLVFGSRHERFIPSIQPEQLALGFDLETKTPEEAVLQNITYSRKKKNGQEKLPAVRMKLPDHLPREQVIIEPLEDTKDCKKIGEEITEELEYIPGKLFVRQYVRPKYAKPLGEGVVIGELPARPIDKGMAGPGLLAQVAVDKFVDHIPLWRQRQRFSREGIEIPYSTISGWWGGTCELILPLGEAHRKAVLDSGYLLADESPIKVQDRDKKGKTHRGFYWVYRDPLRRLVLFDYRKGRGREGPKECLKDFTGYLQTDGWHIYEELFGRRQGVTLLHCWAHARRKFDEALGNDRKRAEWALTEIQKLYAIERKAREERLSEEAILALRQKEAVPILDLLKEWMLKEYTSGVLPESKIGKAINYSLQRWNRLCIYTTHGKLQIDNNLVENDIRAMAVGRKNYLFAGSHQAAKHAAIMYSLFGTCKLHKVNPFEWLRDVLTRIPTYPINKIEQLLPQNWKAVSPEGGPTTSPNEQ